ncbi:MAG: chemotaxis-specific protein-glutamate methyltransferase CheB, partial [candidate division Zixibacteria bacterium]|nr:chemotaxis-specific protein-glutamate methyltransferase CheB [candidate division Zixibacteria bacterium]
MKKIRVLIIDDSAVVRQILTEILSSDNSIEVVGTAMDPQIAREKIKRLKPDVLTLDVEMPKMDGISFLRNLMRLHPLPVIMISSLTEKGADITLKAMELGAVDFVSKPKVNVVHQLEEYSSEIISKIKAAALANIRPGMIQKEEEIETELALDIEKRYSTTVILKKSESRKPPRTTEKIIAIGASTGGTEAIKEILMQMRPDSPGTVIAQHIPSTFSAAFAKRMDSISPMAVREVEDGQMVAPGHVYIAPGSKHLILERE